MGELAELKARAAAIETPKRSKSFGKRVVQGQEEECQPFKIRRPNG